MVWVVFIGELSVKEVICVLGSGGQPAVACWVSGLALKYMLLSVF